MLKEFKEFLLKQNAIALAVGVIIGGAVGKVVDSIVNDIIMPLVGMMMPGGDWRTAQITLNEAGTAAIKYGNFGGRIIDFVIVAAVVFMLTRIFLKEEKKA